MSGFFAAGGWVGLVVALLLWPRDAAAYFDPGSGAVLLQLLIAAVVGGVYKLRGALRSMWQAVAARFRR